MRGLKPVRVLGIAVVVTALASAVAYATNGSSLKIVLPAHAHAHHKFMYSIKGTFPTRPGGAWVIVLSQPKSRACQSTEPKDWHGPSAYEVNWARVSLSPFTVKDKYRGYSRQARRLCAYLYTYMFFPLGNSQGSTLLARATVVIPK